MSGLSGVFAFEGVTVASWVCFSLASTPKGNMGWIALG